MKYHPCATNWESEPEEVWTKVDIALKTGTHDRNPARNLSPQLRVPRSLSPIAVPEPLPADLTGEGKTIPVESDVQQGKAPEQHKKTQQADLATGEAARRGDNPCGCSGVESGGRGLTVYSGHC